MLVAKENVPHFQVNAIPASGRNVAFSSGEASAQSLMLAWRYAPSLSSSSLPVALVWCIWYEIHTVFSLITSSFGPRETCKPLIAGVASGII